MRTQEVYAVTVRIGNLDRIDGTIKTLENIKDKKGMTEYEKQTLTDMVGILEGIQKAPRKFER